jgi:hypothetical protein
MNKVLYFFVAMIIVSCTNNQNQDNTSNEKPEVALAPSGVGDNNVFEATGEVVVIFEPNPARVEKLEVQKDSSYMLSKRRFNAEKEFLRKKIMSMGRQAYFSQEDDIKINVSEKQYYVVYAAGVSGGYGIALAKLNAEPRIIIGIPTMEELEKEMNVYYGPSK